MARKWKILGFLGCLMLCTGFAAFMLPKKLKAIFREEDGVHIDPEKIDESTLIIGTHLIYLGALTDNLYGIAAKSSEESGQNTIYYKSELGEGRWYAINDAGSLKDISEKGREVPDSEIRALYLTHHTKPDGYTYRFTDGAMVSIYDIYSPYDLEGMQELSALAKQKEVDGKGSAIFETDVSTDITDQCDENLKRLSEAYIRLKIGGAGQEQLDILDGIMAKADALRRHEVYQALEAELQDLASQEGGSDAVFNDAVSDAISQVEDGLLDTEGRMLITGRDTDKAAVMTRVEAEFIRKYMEGLDDKILKELATLKHIMDGNTVSPEEEIKFLEDYLIPEAEKAYQESPTDILKNELEYYRSEAQARKQGTAGDSQKLNCMYDEREELKSQRLSALDEENLTEAKRIQAMIEAKNIQIEEEEGAIEREKTSLVNQKTEKEKRVTEARESGEETQGLVSEINEIKGRIASLEDGMDQGSASAKIQEMAKEAETALEQGEEGLERLKEALEGIGALCGTHPGLAGATLKNLYGMMEARKYMEDTGIYDGLLSETEEMAASSLKVLGEGLDAESAVKIMEDNTSGDRTAALMGLSMFCAQVSGSNLENILKGKAESYAQSKEAYAFRSLPGEKGESYACTEAVARYASFRYVWNDNKKQATLASRSSYYKFVAFDNKVTREEGEEELSAPAGFQETVYMPSDYAKQEFGCEVYSMPGTGYCILINDKIAEEASVICDLLLEKGE